MAISKTIQLTINATAKGINDVKGKITGLAKSITFLSGTAIIGAAKAFKDFESALNGVGKTSGMAGKELQDFGKRASKLSKEIAVPTNELLGMAQAAAQLGVRGSDNILKFSETVAKLGKTTNLAGEDAAISLARIMSLSGEATDNVAAVAGVIVELDNNFAAAAAEITHTATQVTQGIAAFKPAVEDVFALSTALAASGVQAERARGVMGRAFIGIQEAIAKGSFEMRNLEKLTGLSGDALKREFDTNATEVFRRFVGGLSKVSKEEMPELLEQFGIAGSEGISTLSALTANVGVMEDAFVSAREEFKRGGDAMEKEFGVRTNELNFKWQKLKITLVDFAKEIGARLAPALSRIVDKATQFVETISPQQLDAIAGSLNKVLSFVEKIGGAFTSLNRYFTEFRIGWLELEKNLIRINQAIDFRPDWMKSKISQSVDEKMAARIAEIEQLQNSLAQGVMGGGATPISDATTMPDASGAAGQGIIPTEGQAPEAAQNGEGQTTITGLFLESKDNLEKRWVRGSEFLKREAELAHEHQQQQIQNEIQTQKTLDDAYKSSLAGRLTAFLNLDKKISTTNKKQNENLVKTQQQTQEALTNIVSVAAQKNAAIGKAFAIANAIWNTYQGVNLALATIPPPQGYVVAGITLASGLANVASIVSTGFANGGMATGGTKGKDSIPAMYMPGELIAPERSFDEVVEGTALARGWTPPNGNGGGKETRIVLEMKGDLGRFIQEQIRESDDLGTYRGARA